MSPRRSTPAPAPDGTTDIAAAGAALAARLPEASRPLGHAAYDLRWSWTPGGEDAYRRLDPQRWDACGRNPVRFLRDLDLGAVPAGADAAPVEAPEPTAPAELERPVAFFCAEYALHPALRIYSGGLGVLAGDICKEASDRAVPMVAVGLFYRQGFFQQRLDVWGRQHEYWVPLDPHGLPMARVTADGAPVTVTVTIRRRDVVCQVWRVDVGRVPLYLLDTDVADNHPVDRWITARLYVADRATRLAQYAVLGIGGVRALRAMGVEPAGLHLNEGHAALAPLELARPALRRGLAFSDALSDAGGRTVFTTHTPVPAGNEEYEPREFKAVLGGYPGELGIESESLLDLARVRRGRPREPLGMTVLGLRVSGWANGVSARHGTVARKMWRRLFGVPADRVPIRHVTNGVHLPTWLAPPLRELLDGYLGAGWTARADEPATWEGVDRIPDAELWAVRCLLRSRLVDYVRDRSVRDRLGRGETERYVEAAARTLDEDALTVGFARRVATYKRLRLLTLDPGRALALLGGSQPVQLLIAGKAHPADEEGKSSLQQLFGIKNAPPVADRVAYLEDYDLEMAAILVGGCDVWLNLPRPPLEASGTSGMKSALNGGLNLSVLDGWWPEAYDGENGWAIAGDTLANPAEHDMRDANAFYELMETAVVPLFYERDAAGVPVGWVRRVKAALKSIGPAFSATRMVTTYRDDAYRHLRPRA